MEAIFFIVSMLTEKTLFMMCVIFMQA
uniref:Uncharacterized protein n=1 Tax=Anguilla anguilla TaxID=7936 RepID=A0A0E9QFC8_ANGAN